MIKLNISCHIVVLLFILCSCVEWADETSSGPPSKTATDSGSQADSIRIKIINFNVSSADTITPIIASKILMPHNFDIICLNEIPDNDWAERLGKILNINYVFKGKISSANKKNKYKGIISRFPLINTNEFILRAENWQPASVISVTLEKNSNNFTVYCLQIASSEGEKGSYANIVATDIIRRIKDTRIIVAGDFANKPSDKAMKIFEEEGMNNVWNELDIDTTVVSVNAKLFNSSILYSRASRAHTMSGGYINLAPELSKHKPVWAMIEFPPPRVKKKKGN